MCEKQSLSSEITVQIPLNIHKQVQQSDKVTSNGERNDTKTASKHHFSQIFAHVTNARHGTQAKMFNISKGHRPLSPCVAHILQSPARPITAHATHNKRISLTFKISSSINCENFYSNEKEVCDSLVRTTNLHSLRYNTQLVLFAASIQPSRLFPLLPLYVFSNDNTFRDPQKNPVPPRSVPAGQAISDPSAELVLPRSSDDIKCERSIHYATTKHIKHKYFIVLRKKRPTRAIILLRKCGAKQSPVQL